MESITALSIGNLSERETNHCTLTILQKLPYNCNAVYYKDSDTITLSDGYAWLS